MRSYSDETKAAVIAAVLAGASIRVAAREHGVPRGTVQGWLTQAGHIRTVVRPEKRTDLGELIGDYLRDGLRALAAQARLFADPAWVAKQPAGELAILHGVLADKLTRLVTALEPVDDPALLDATRPPDPPGRG